MQKIMVSGNLPECNLPECNLPEFTGNFPENLGDLPEFFFSKKLIWALPTTRTEQWGSR